VELNQRQDVLQSLRSAAGYLNDVIEMITAGAPCDQVLRQSFAVQATLRNASIRMLVYQAQYSGTVIVESSCPEEIKSELKRLSELYLILIQYSNKSEDNIS